MYKNKNKKIFAGVILGITMFTNISFLTVPKKTEAVVGVEDTTHDFVTNFFTGIASFFSSSTSISSSTSAVNESTQTGLKFKDVAKDILAEIGKNIAKRILAQITEDTVNWINNGFEGKPLFLENPDAFYMDIRDQEIIGFTDAIGYDKLNFPYAKGFLLGYIQSQKNQFSSWAQSSLNRSLADRGKTLTEFAGDFNVGGFDGWLQLTQVPQNNPWGFQIEATEDISRRVGGLVQTKAQSIKKEIDLGSGFMSPKICVDPGPMPLGYAKKARDAQDKINKAVSKSTGAVITSGTGVTMSGGVTMTGSGGTISSNDPSVISLQQTIDANTCKREEATTPGTVVASQITLALGSKVRQSELGAALGNSLSAVFDALLNKLVDTAAGGLTSLVTSDSPEEEKPGDWSYFGESLGVDGSTTGTPSNWAEADKIVSLSVFKQNVQKAIKNTSEEISILRSNNSSTPGIIELINNIPTKVEAIDQCMPGPNLGWEKRLKEQENVFVQEIMTNADPDSEDANDSDGMRPATKAISELAYAIDSFTAWIKNYMVSEIPSAPLILDELKKLKNNEDDLRKFDLQISKKIETLSRLKSIQSYLNTINIDPTPKSANAILMLEQNVKYNSLASEITSDENLNEIKAESDKFKERNKNIDDLLTSCKKERLAKGYTPFVTWPDFSTGMKSNPLAAFHFGTEDMPVGNSGGTEKQLFCGWPIEGGFAHGTFSRNTVATYANLPLVNGNDVFDGDDITIDCNYIYPSSKIEYIKAGSY